MRFARLTLLHSYFSIINKNKKKALALINIGIFFSFFALSAALISFYIEKKISNKQEELFNVQIEVNDYSQLIQTLEASFNLYEISLGAEELFRVDIQLLSETNLGNKIFTTKDFYGPYILSFERMLKDLESLESADGIDIFDTEGEIMTYIFSLIEGAWDEEDVKKFKQSVADVEKTNKIIKEINFDKYNFKKITSLEDMTLEIINFKDYHVNKFTHSDSPIADDYFKINEHAFNLKYFMRDFLKLFKGLQSKGETTINTLNEEIISLSKKEKNIILITFIFQFLIFVIIQIFEINSFNYNFKKKFK